MASSSFLLIQSRMHPLNRSPIHFNSINSALIIPRIKNLIPYIPSFSPFRSRLNDYFHDKPMNRNFSKKSSIFSDYSSFKRLNSGLAFYNWNHGNESNFFHLMNPRRKSKGRAFMSISIVLPDQAIWALLISCAALGQSLEENTKIGSRISAPLLSLFIAMSLSSLGIFPVSSNAYDQVWEIVVPLAIAFSLLETNLKQAFLECGPTLTAFFVGALGTIAGTVVSFFFVGEFLGVNGWKIASCFCATYIGGSVNYAATAQALGMGSGSLLIGGMAADNFLMAIYFTVIMSIPATWPLEETTRHPRDPNDGSDDESKYSDMDYPYYTSESEDENNNISNITKKGKNITAFNILCCCAAGFFSSYFGETLATVLPSLFNGSKLAFSALIASSLSAIISLFINRRRRRRKGKESAKVQIFHGSETLGSALMLVFFSTLGATANFYEAFSKSFPLFVFGGILLFVHLIFSLLVGRILNLPLQSILVASNANVGGPATSSAMATARGWTKMVRPALLVGTLGYTIGTGMGCFVGLNILKPMAASLFPSIL